MRNIILGTDWWTDCDDTAAVRILCRMIDRGVWNLRGIVLNGCTEYSAASLFAVLRDAGYPDIPIGIDPDADDFGGRPPYQKPVAFAAGTQYIRNESMENGLRLYRKLLSEAKDHSMELLEIGYLQVLGDLVCSPPDDLSPLSGQQLLRQKVNHIWMMAGHWKNNGYGRENNFCRNHHTAAGAARFLSMCPCPITFLGYEVGETVLVHPPKDKQDLIHIAFDAHGSAGGRSAWDPMLVMLAATGDLAAAGYISVRGTASVCPGTGCNAFSPNPDGLHEYVVKTHPDDWYAAILNAILSETY